MGRPATAACSARAAPEEWPYTDALPPAPAVVIDHGEALCQLPGGRASQSPVAHRPAHHYDRLTVAQPIEGDGGAIRRAHRVHEEVLSRRVLDAFLVPSRA